MTDDQHKLFLSYANDEAPFVREVAAELQRRGLTPWFDRAEIVPGSRWGEDLYEALTTSSAVVILIGAGTTSSQMNFELGAALGQAKPVVPVFLTEHGGRGLPRAVSELDGIDAHSLTPEEVAQRIAEAVR